jgi:hypothetical protein
MPVPGTLGACWRWFRTPPSHARLMKRLAWSLWITPIIMGLPFWLLPLLEPASIPGILAEFWLLYLLFFGLPFVLGCLALRSGNRS